MFFTRKKLPIDGIIFMDGEFNGLSTKGIDFLSIALIRPRTHFARHGCIDKDRELYIEFDLPEKIDPWVNENVVPHLECGRSSRIIASRNAAATATKPRTNPEAAMAAIKEFVGPGKPHMIADVNQFDWMGICGLFGVFGQPFHYIPIDFASILFTKGIDPDIDRFELSKKKGIDTRNFKRHNALDDCRVLKELYSKLR